MRYDLAVTTKWVENAAQEAAALQAAAQAGAAQALVDANLSYDLVRTAAGEAIDAKFGDPVPVPPSAAEVAAATAAVVAPALQYHNGSFGADVDFTFTAAPASGNRLAIYGFIATGGIIQFNIEFRSGIGGMNSQFSPNPCIFTVGAGSSPSMTPGTQPLWYTANDQGLAVLKSSTQTCHLQVWWRVVPNS